MQRRDLILGAGGLLGGPRWAQACQSLDAALLAYPGSTLDPQQGLDAALMRAIAEPLGCPLRFHATNVTRLWSELASGRMALSCGVAHLRERLDAVDYLVLVRQRMLVLMKRELAERVPTRAEFDADPSLLLGVLRGARRGAQTQAWVDQLREQGRIREGLDMAGLHRAFEVGRVSAMLMLPLSLEGRDAAWWQTHRLPDWFGQDRIVSGIAVSHRGVAPDLRERLRDSASALYRGGHLHALAARHLGEKALRGLELLPLDLPPPPPA